MYPLKSCRLLAGLLLLVVSKSPLALTLDQAVALAIESDPFLPQSEQQQLAMDKKAIAAKQLPDPMFRLGVANLPTDTFNLDQEPFTQLQLGITQQFPRGDSRHLRAKKMQSLAAIEPWMRANRKAEVRLGVTRYWLELYEVQQSIRLIESDRSLFDYLVEATKASYVSAVGRSQQYDVVRAQLELTRLEERLLALKQREQMLRAALSEWLGQVAMSLEVTQLPTAPQSEVRTVVDHPRLRAKQQEIEAKVSEVELVAQAYKPGWSVSTSYGRRQDDQLGNDRADFFSVALSFDLPVFTSNKQDQLVDAAQAELEAERLERDLLQRSLNAALLGAKERDTQLSHRIALYESKLLEQMAEQAEAALSAYTNDTGDFSDVVRARISELEARLALVAMSTEQQIIRNEILYYLQSGEERS